MRNFFKSAIRAGFLFLTMLPGAWAALPVEIAQSIPIETTLAVPGIRSTQAVWLEMINSARASIDFEEFYLFGSPGQSLDPILKAIAAATKRGVQVRFVIDSKFYKTYPEIPNSLNRLPNVEVRVIDLGPGIQHSKYFVVDQSQVFVGSANFDWLALTHIHEVGMRVGDGGVSAALSSVFETDWAVSKIIKTSGRSLGHAPRPRTAPSLPNFRVVASPHAGNPNGVSDTLPALTGLMAAAQRTLKIQVYQYTTKGIAGGWKVLDSAIRRAASRGVQVELLVDAAALKTGKADLTALAALPNIAVRYVTIPEWSGGPLDFARLVHSKYLIVDREKAWVGTENWSVDYFTNSRNVGIVFKAPEVAMQLEKIHDRVWNSNYVTSL